MTYKPVFRLLTSLLSWLLVACCLSAAQTPVILMPVPKPQYFTQTGLPLAFGCVFTYAQGSTTPLASYTDVTGTTPNANPVVLSAGGTASIWIQAGVAYRILVMSPGGVNCASGSTLYTVDGIGGGVTTLTTNVTYSATPFFQDSAQNQLFKITLTGNASSQPMTAVGIIAPGLVTWEITQDNAGGHTFTWPANTTGGCTIGTNANQVTLQHFIWDGTTAIATGPCVVGNGPNINFGVGLATALASACANPASAGFIRLCFTDSLLWRNAANSGNEGLSVDAVDALVVSNLGGVTLTGTTPAVHFGGETSSFPLLLPSGTTLKARLADNSADAPFSAALGTFSAHIAVDGTTITATTPTANQVLTASSSSAAGFAALPNSVLVASLTTNTGQAIGASAQTWITKAVTMPASGCPCRALVSYGAMFTSSNSGTAVFWVEDGTNQFASAQGLTNTAGGTSPGVAASSISPVTYANNAVVTFVGRGYTNASGGLTLAAANFGSTQNSWLSIAIFSSN